jgi:MFS superfamily sulfate permease-like transporter
VIYIFKRAWQPYSTVLGKPQGIPGYHDIRRYPDADQVPGLLIVRWSAPLFFANATVFRERIRELVRSSEPRPAWVLIAAEPITDIDTTAGTILRDLDLELNAAGISLAFAELPSDVRDAMLRYGLLETIDQGHFYSTVSEAVDGYRREVLGRASAADSSSLGDQVRP